MGRLTFMKERTEGLIEALRPFKGKGALIPEHVEEVTPPEIAGLRLSAIEYLRPERLRPNPLNDYPPLDEDEFRELKEDIEEKGVLVSLMARPDGVLLCGHNRLRAAQALKLPLVPVQIVMSPLTPELEREIMKSENERRRGGGWSREKKLDFIREHFGDSLGVPSARGGNRGNQHTGGRQSSLNLATEIEKKSRGRITEGTAKRLVSELRKAKSLESRDGLNGQKEFQKPGNPGKKASKAAGASSGAGSSRAAPDPVKVVDAGVVRMRKALEGADADTAQKALDSLDVLRGEFRKIVRDGKKQAEKSGKSGPGRKSAGNNKQEGKK